MKGLTTQSVCSVLSTAAMAMAVSACSVEASAPPMPFTPSAPIPPPATASAGKTMNVEGIWESPCAWENGAYQRQVLTIKDDAMDADVKMYNSSTCTGKETFAITVKAAVAYVGKSVYVIGGSDADVTITNPDGTKQTNPVVFLLEFGKLYLSDNAKTTPGQRPNSVDWAAPFKKIGG